MSFDVAISRVHDFGKRFLRFFYRLPFSPFRGIVYRMLRSETKTILDAGCGFGEASEAIKIRNPSLHIIGAEVSLERLCSAKKRGFLDDSVLCDIRYLPFRNSSVDTVLCIEVIEHLKKTEGVHVLKDLEIIGCKQVIVTTPVGYAKEPSTVSGIDFLKHISGWTPLEFKGRGYKVRGMIGPKMSILPNFVAYWISFIFCPTYFLPNLSYVMICVKIR